MNATIEDESVRLPSQFSGRRYINLESFRKNGESKQTPVQSLEKNGLIYFETDPRTWKVKRIRNNPHVRIVPSDRSGKPTGTWVDGDAEILKGEENERMLKLFKQEYGSIGNVIVGFIARLRRERLTAVVRIMLRSSH